MMKNRRIFSKGRSSHQRCSMKIDVLRNFTKFTGNHLCQNLSFNKVAGLRSVKIQKGFLTITVFIHFSCLVRGTPFYFLELAPIAIVLAFNIVSLVAIMLSLNKTQKYSASTLSMKDRLRIIVAFMILFGITWTFGFLVINNDIIIFQYLFCIIASLQGLFIFGFYCLRNPKVRKYSRAIFRGEKLGEIRRNSINYQKKPRTQTFESTLTRDSDGKIYYDKADT